MANPDPDTFLTLMSQVMAGAPQAKALGIELVSIGEDNAVLKVHYREDLIGDPDTRVIAGGVVTTLLDHTCGYAVFVALKAPIPIVTLDLRIDYMRPAEPDRDLFAQAHCYKLTRSVAFVRAQAYERDPADPVATVQAAFMLNREGGPKAGANLAPAT